METLLFIDEIHRFSKSQQDSLLSPVEQGTVILIGATTENPSFKLNNALLSRLRVYVLRSLSVECLTELLKTALTDKVRGLGGQSIIITDELLAVIARSADGDARRSLNLLQITVDLADNDNGTAIVNETVVNEALQGHLRRFDNKGEQFYDQISALHKSVRGSNPDAALYWFCRMIDGGCDPIYIARRIVRIASEDIGNADPRALTLTLAAWDSYDRLGSPEGELALAQAIIYLSVAAKSNAVYTAYNEALAEVKNSGSLDVPLHLRNAPTKLMDDLDYGKDYRYAHNEREAYAAGENYFPEKLRESHYYKPVARGLEIKIKQKLDYLRTLDLDLKR
jgi:putative ATPase